MIGEQQSFSTRARDVPPTNGHLRCAPRLDDPHFVDERERAATPPHLYERTLREALRLTPIGESFCFERTGLLAHPHMLGPNDDSDECASSKDYGALLRLSERRGQAPDCGGKAESRASPGRTFRKLRHDLYR